MKPGGLAFEKWECTIPDKDSPQQLSLHPLLGNRRNRLLVERDKRLAAQPAPFVHNHAIGKIRASRQNSETSLNCCVIQYNILDPA